MFVTGMLHFSRFFIRNKFIATYVGHMCVKCEKSVVNPFKQDMIGHIFTKDII